MSTVSITLGQHELAKLRLLVEEAEDRLREAEEYDGHTIHNQRLRDQMQAIHDNERATVDSLGQKLSGASHELAERAQDRRRSRPRTG